MRKCIESIVATTDAELLVIDNGGSLTDSEWLLELCEQKKIACYVRNRNNMSFAYGYNQGAKLASGEYLAFVSNDIVFSEGWMEECIGFLEKHSDKKLLATPLGIDRIHRQEQYARGMLDGWELNSAAGSNVFVVRRTDFESIGNFEICSIAGTRWMRRYSKMGYVMACMPEPKAIDKGFKKGFNWKKWEASREL